MHYRSSTPSRLVIPEGMQSLNEAQSGRIEGAARREGALAWRVGPVLYTFPFLGPFSLLLALL